MTSNPVQSPTEAAAVSEQFLLDTVRELDFGTVEVVIHEGQIVEVSQKRRRRFSCQGQRTPNRNGA